MINKEKQEVLNRINNGTKDYKIIQDILQGHLYPVNPERKVMLKDAINNYVNDYGIFTATANKSDEDLISVFDKTNTLIVGSAGTGKSQSVRQSILKGKSNYFVVDHGNNLLDSCKQTLTDNGYKIKVFDYNDVEHSEKINILSYIKDTSDISFFVKWLSDDSGQFWYESVSNLITACIYYLESVNKKSLKELYNLLSEYFVIDDEENKTTHLDNLFHSEELNDKCMAKHYERFNGSPGTKVTIINTLRNALEPYANGKFSEITNSGEFNFDEFSDDKMTIFIEIPEVKNNFASLMYMLVDNIVKEIRFEELKENKYIGDFIPIRFILDEFANIGKIPNLDVFLDEEYNFNISTLMLVQDMEQISTLYKGDDRIIEDIIINSIDTLINFGSCCASDDTVAYTSIKANKDISRNDFAEAYKAGKWIITTKKVIG